jgi:hypothetical protein
MQMDGGGLVADCVITDNRTAFTASSGGGISMVNGTVQDCVIEGNRATDRQTGGIGLYRSRMFRCLVRNNSAVGAPGGKGGGASGGESSFIDCRFENNVAHGPFGSLGGAIESGGESSHARNPRCG